MYGVQCSQDILKDLFQLSTEAMGMEDLAT